MKGRICWHVNRDKHKNKIRKDSSNAQFDVIRPLLFLAVMLGFRIGATNVKGAFMKSCPITRDLYVRPPKELMYIFPSLANKIWKLLLLPDAVCEAGRHWTKRREEWILNVCHFESVHGAIQHYVLRNADGMVFMLLIKVTDYLLMASTPTKMRAFL